MWWASSHLSKACGADAEASWRTKDSTSRPRCQLRRDPQPAGQLTNFGVAALAPTSSRADASTPTAQCACYRVIPAHSRPYAHSTPVPLVLFSGGR